VFLTKVTGVAFHEALHQTVNSEGESLARELTFKAGDIVSAVVSFLETDHTNETIKETIRDILEQHTELESFKNTEEAGEFITSQGGYNGYAMAESSGESRSGEGVDQDVSGGEVSLQTDLPSNRSGVNEQGFYSQMERVIEKKMGGSATIDQIKGMLTARNLLFG
jgi:hypothetical protein